MQRDRLNGPFHRRAWLECGSLILASSLVPDMRADGPLAGTRDADLRVGLVTDLHYADKAPAGSRHYRETLGKLEEAAERFDKAQANFVVELGDFIDAADSVEVERAYLKRVNAEFSQISQDRHYVLGNHCVDTLTKGEFLEGVEQKKSYYSFDRGAFHFVILDACFRSDGKPYGRRNFQWTDANIPAAELAWLQADLKGTAKQTIVFAHQRLDVRSAHGVKNNEAVRQVLEASGNVLAVFQGHSHQNDLNTIGGIHYCTLVAMVEGSGKASSGYSLLELGSNGTIRLSGFRKQQSHSWPERAKAG